jgi:hypothetical protein
MRDFLYCEIARINGMVNLPDDPDIAIAAGRGLCEHLLEPLQWPKNKHPESSFDEFSEGRRPP